MWVDDENSVTLADLPVLGRPTRLMWNKRRWRCAEEACAVRAFTEQQPLIASPMARMTSWATRQAGKARAVSEITAELGCNWHTTMAPVQRWGQAVLDADPDRLDGVPALGLEELLMFRRSRCQHRYLKAA